MRFFLLALLAGTSAAAGAIRGFNTGGTSLFAKGAKTQVDFEREFRKLRHIKGTDGFNSVRLFTTIQAGTVNDPVLAIPAAIATKTKLLLGLWASGGQQNFDNELIALRRGIEQYKTNFTNLIVGISVGSEDLYRVSPTGILNKSGSGSSPDELLKYIQQTRDKLKGTPIEGKKLIGHVDTWNAWINGSNSPVINAVDWIGMDGYPYYQKENDNRIENAAALFFESYKQTVAVSQGKPVWVTETGWPVTGDTFGKAVPSRKNAQKYWHDVGCKLLGKTNLWWFALDDSKANPKEISFSVLKPNLGDPLFDLTCKK